MNNNLRNTALWKDLSLKSCLHFFFSKRPVSWNRFLKIYSFIFGIPFLAKMSKYYCFLLAIFTFYLLFCFLFMFQTVVIVVGYSLMLTHGHANLGENLAKLFRYIVELYIRFNYICVIFINTDMTK